MLKYGTTQRALPESEFIQLPHHARASYVFLPEQSDQPGHRLRSPVQSAHLPKHLHNIRICLDIDILLSIILYQRNEHFQQLLRIHILQYLRIPHQCFQTAVRSQVGNQIQKTVIFLFLLEYLRLRTVSITGVIAKLSMVNQPVQDTQATRQHSPAPLASGIPQS